MCTIRVPHLIDSFLFAPSCPGSVGFISSTVSISPGLVGLLRVGSCLQFVFTTDKVYAWHTAPAAATAATEAATAAPCMTKPAGKSRQPLTESPSKAFPEDEG